MNDEPLSLLRRFLRAGAHHPRQSLLFLLMISLVAAWGTFRLTIDTGFTRLIKPDGAEHQAYLQIAREFGSDHRSFIYLRDEQLWTPGKLAALEQLHEKLRQLPFVERIDDLFSSPITRSLDGQLYAQALLVSAPADEQGADRVRQDAMANPIALRNIVSADGKAIAIGIAMREGRGGASATEVDKALENVLGPARAQFPSMVHIGPSRTEAEIRESLERDLRVLLPAVGLAGMLVVFLFCRSFFAAALPVAVGALSLLWTFGMMGFAGIPLTLFSAMLPALVLLVAITKIMRMASGYTQGQASALGQVARPDRNHLTEFMIRHLGMPVVISVLAMGLGFAGNAFTDIGVIHDFSLVAAFAILASGLITILLIPALYALCGSRLRKLQRFALAGWFSRHASRAIGILRHRAVPWVVFVVTGAYGALALQSAGLQVISDPLAFFRPEHSIVQAAEHLHDELAGPKLFYITLDAHAEGAFRDPANLRRLSDIQAFIAKQHIFDRSFSVADIVAQANQEDAGGRPDAYHVPSSRKLVGQYLLLQPPQALEPYISHDLRRANIIVRHNVRESTRLNRHLRELRQAVSNYAGPSMVTTIVGENLLINAPADRLPMDLIRVFAALLLFVFIGMSLLFTSAKGGIIALVPNVLPMLVILGGMRIFEIPLSAATVMIAILIIGTAIEGTLHLFSRYSELCRNASDYDEAVIETLKMETAPMAAISLALAAVFGVLAFSEFALIAQFGGLAAAAMLASLFANLLITPLVMSRIRLVGLYEILAMSMRREALVDSPLFRGMTEYQIRKTILISELREYLDNEYLIEQGSRGRSMYLVVSGQLEVMRRDKAGEQRRALLGPGDVFGEIGFVHPTYRTADVRALGTVTVLRFDHDRLKKDLVFFPYIMAKLNFNISGILGQRLAEVVEEYQPSPARDA